MADRAQRPEQRPQTFACLAAILVISAVVLVAVGAWQILVLQCAVIAIFFIWILIARRNQ